MKKSLNSTEEKLNKEITERKQYISEKSKLKLINLFSELQNSWIKNKLYKSISCYEKIKGYGFSKDEIFNILLTVYGQKST